MRRLKTIDELYEEVRDYGLVITNDAPLETALNARIDTPRIGPLAMTPRHIALLLGPVALGKPFLSDLELISKVSEETQLSFRHVYGDIQNFREIRRHTKDVGDYITTRNSRLIYDSYIHLPTLEASMGVFDPDDPRFEWFFQRADGVAVIGVDVNILADVVFGVNNAVLNGGGVNVVHQLPDLALHIIANALVVHTLDSKL